MSHDTELLRRYIKDGSESAFSELVTEHLNLVYSAALRETNGDGPSAEDISQAVFTELARKASKLLGHPSLAGWLYTTVRHMAANLRRSEQRRRTREEEVEIMSQLLSDEAPEETWHQIRPVLDDALHELKDTDREALVLRFLEDRPLREVGARLGLNENAARMRVDRALEKLRGLLGRRGITSTASGLTAAMAIGVITPAPPALAATIVTATLAGGAAVGSTTLTLMNLMSITKVTLVSALIVAGVAVPVWQQTRLQRLRSENAQLRAWAAEARAQEPELTALRDQVGQLSKVEADRAELERLRQWQAQTQPELLRLRGMAGVARRANLEAEQLRGQLTRQASDAATNPVSGAMADAMKQAMRQQVEGRLARMAASVHLSPDQVQAARDILRQQADATSARMQQMWSGKYDQNQQAELKEVINAEEQIKALLTPEQKDAYANYQKEELTYNARLMANNELLQLQSTLGLTSEQQDRAFAALYQANLDQFDGTSKAPPADKSEALQWAFDQKAKALESVLTPTQLQDYRRQQEAQIKLAKAILGKMQDAGEGK